MDGLLILIIDRGIIKVALARGRFQLRISVSLGTIGWQERKRRGRERERERERQGKARNWGRMVEESSFTCIYYLSRSSFTYSLKKMNRG